MPKLGERDVMAAEVLVERGRSIRGLAKDFGVDESTLRYRLGRRRARAQDGRRLQPEACAALGGVIAAWLHEHRRGERRPAPLAELYEVLVREHGYTGSYKAVVRYVRRREGAPTMRPIRRVEVRPGTQVQIDWLEDLDVWIQAIGGLTRLAAFLMTLSYSRMWALIWSVHQDMLNWIRCHNEAFAFLGGVAQSGRIDNLKTGVASGAGAWALVNAGYRTYADQVGFIVDPCRPAKGSDKGKVERRGRDCRTFLGGLLKRRYADMDELQVVTNEHILARASALICPATGRSILESWRHEREHLRPLPESLPEPFDVQVIRQASRDCLVSFEGRAYQVPNTCMLRSVLVRGCAQTVEIFSPAGTLLTRYPRRTDCRILLDQAMYDEPGDERVMAATPLGRVARAIVLERSWETPRRAIDAYAELVGGGR